MADNLNIDQGSTLTVGTDLIGGVHYQRVKIVHGDDGTANDAGTTTPFPVTIASATLGTVTISGTVTPSTTATTITNAGSINVNVATATLGTVSIAGTGTAGTPGTLVLAVQGIANGTAQPISGSVNVATATLGTVTISGNVNVATATLGTVTITGTVTPSTTATTITNAGSINVNVATATLGTVTVSGNVNISSATLGTVTITGSVTNSVSTIPIMSKTLTGTSGSFTATNATLFTPTNKAKVYAFSLTTTSASELICVFHTGGLELWRATLMAPAGANSGANLATTPPSWLFASRTGTAVSLSISSAVLIHYAISLFDEA